MTQPVPLRCRCGSLRGTMAQPERARRLVCYCADCQAYAHALGDARQVLDMHGGTAIVATLQERIALTQGREHLACMMLTPSGIYRWYAACCRTPIANTTRRPQMSYVGIVHAALASSRAELVERWPDSFAVNTARAKAAVVSPRARVLRGALALAAMVLGARLRGSWRQSPFFVDGTRQPVVAPTVLAPQALAAARRHV